MSDEVGDFFARKDKSKKKGKKSKFTTTDQILSHAEVQVQQQTERENAVHAPAPLRPARRTKEDEEWKDFQEEHVPDLSGLKIQSLSKMKQSQAEQGENNEEGAAAAGEAENSDAEEQQQQEKPQEEAHKSAAPRATTSSGGRVWATGEDEDDSDREMPIASASEPTVASSTAAESSSAAAAPAAAAAGAATANVAGGKYIPPSQRRGVAGQAMDTSTVDAPPTSSGKYVPPSQRRAMEAASQQRTLAPMQMGSRRPGGRTTAPDVNSDEAFPSLQAVTTGVSAPRAPGFQDVRGGAAAPTYSQQRTAGVSLENRYSNLR